MIFNANKYKSDISYNLFPYSLDSDTNKPPSYIISGHATASNFQFLDEPLSSVTGGPQRSVAMSTNSFLSQSIEYKDGQQRWRHSHHVRQNVLMLHVCRLQGVGSSVTSQAQGKVCICLYSFPAITSAIAVRVFNFDMYSILILHIRQN